MNDNCHNNNEEKQTFFFMQVGQVAHSCSKRMYLNLLDSIKKHGINQSKGCSIHHSQCSWDTLKCLQIVTRAFLQTLKLEACKQWNIRKESVQAHTAKLFQLIPGYAKIVYKLTIALSATRCRGKFLSALSMSPCSL